MKKQLISMGVSLFVAGLATAQTPTPQYGAPITLDAARRAMAGAEAEAKKNNWPVVIAVVDNSGHLVLLQRLENAQIGSIDIATGKARTSAQFRRPSKAFEDAVAGGRTALVAVPGITPLEGGLPIMSEGKVIGAIGVSGVTSQQDAQIAKAGLDALGAAQK